MTGCFCGAKVANTSYTPKKNRRNEIKHGQNTVLGNNQKNHKTMRNLLKALLFCTMPFLFGTACSQTKQTQTDEVSFNGAKVIKTYNVSGFNSLSATNGIKVVYQPVNNGKIAIKAEVGKEYADRFKLSVRNKVLRIELSRAEANRQTYNNAPAVVTVTGPMLENVHASGGARIDITGNIVVSQTFKAKANSAGTITCADLHATDIDLNTNSAGNIVTKELQCRNIDFNANSAGNITARRIKCNDMSIDANSAGNITATQVKCNNIDIDASSAGNVNLSYIDCAAVQVSATSTAQVDIAGKCKGHASYDASSIARITADQVTSASVSASAHSMGRVSCQSTETMKTSTGSGGKIEFRR